MRIDNTYSIDDNFITAIVPSTYRFQGDMCSIKVKINDFSNSTLNITAITAPKIVKRKHGQEIINITRNVQDLIPKHHKIKLDINFIKKCQKARRFHTYFCNSSSSNKIWGSTTQKENHSYNYEG